MNSEQAALQLRMEGSRRGKENIEKGLPTPDQHVDGGNSAKKPQYIIRRKKKIERHRKKRLKEKERERAKG